MVEEFCLIFPRLFFWKVRDMSESLLPMLFNLAMIRKSRHFFHLDKPPKLMTHKLVWKKYIFRVWHDHYQTFSKADGLNHVASVCIVVSGGWSMRAGLGWRLGDPFSGWSPASWWQPRSKKLWMNFSFSFVEWTILLTTALLNVTSCHDKFILRAHQLCLEIGNLPSINMSKYMQCLADSHMFQPAFCEKMEQLKSRNHPMPWLTEQWTHAPGTKTCMRRA